MRNRGGIISARAGYEERQKLKEQAAAAGYDNLSDFLRFKLGLPRGIGVTAPLPDMNDLDDIGALVRNQVELLSRIDNLIRDITHIRRHLAISDEPQAVPAVVVSDTLATTTAANGHGGDFQR